jgi:CDK-activating kinase assembly factor MAT1
VLRAEVMKIYNKPRESFPPDANGLRQYNDYLENIEKIVFNLLSDVDVEKTQNVQLLKIYIFTFF